MHYTFDPKEDRLKGAPDSLDTAADTRHGFVYVCDDKLKLAVNVALVTKRPLLLRGPSGTGKSSLAKYVANVLNWAYYEHVVSSRTEAQNLFYRFDSVRRLCDAQTGKLNSIECYLSPGVLWRAFSPTSALVPEASSNDMRNSVVLIDEIDKADLDVPNDLLVAIGSREFNVPEQDNRRIKFEKNAEVLLIVTTNDERELPAAFLRRCIVHEIEAPDEKALVKIAGAHCIASPLVKYIAKEVCQLRGEISKDTIQCSTAEFIDALHACNELEIQEDTDEHLKSVLKATLIKPRSPEFGRKKAGKPE